MPPQNPDAPAFSGNDQIKIGQKRIHQVFKYLHALHEHRNPAKRQIDEQPWWLWLDTLPDHPAIVRRQTVNDEEENGSSEADENRVAPILSVERPKLSDGPPPPVELRAWLKPGWEKPENQCEHLPQREQQDKNG